MTAKSRLSLSWYPWLDELVDSVTLYIPSGPLNPNNCSNPFSILFWYLEVYLSNWFEDLLVPNAPIVAFT